MRDFVKYTLASLTGSILFFVLLVGFTAIGAIGLVGALIAGFGQSDDQPQIEDQTVLVYDLSTVMNDSQYVPTPSEAILGGVLIDQLTLREAILAIEAAADDDRIAALYLEGGYGVGVGIGSLSALRRAIATFKESGKPIIAYAPGWNEGEYYLASAADTIAMNPLGDMEMNGLYSEVLYPAEAFEKIGVEFQVTRAGRYKSAVEPLIQSTMSPEEREQTQRLLGDLWTNIITTAAEHRSLTPAQMQAIANSQGLLFGDAATASGLVDQLAYADEIVTELRDITEEDEDENPASFRQIALADYADLVDDPAATRDAADQIALIYAEGSIVDGFGGVGSQVVAGDSVAQELRELRQDEDVKAIVLRVNSPGGSALASEVILRELQLAQADGYPVVVSMGNLAASGGYWIASSADRIFAEPTTITGSIGVFGVFANLAELGDKVGINWETVKTSETADIFSESRPKSPAELATLQASVDQVYNLFLERVATGRELPRDRVAEIAQGRVWSGAAALELGLVDELGGLDEALAAAAELAELGDDWQLRQQDTEDSWQLFIEQFGVVEAAAASDPLTKQLLIFKDEIMMLRTFNDPQHTYARLPFTLRVR